MSTVENWQAVLYRGIDTVGYQKQPEVENSPENAWFFVAMILIGSWFILGLFIGTVIDNFNRIRFSEDFKGSVYLTDEQRDWVQLQRVMISVKPQTATIDKNTNIIRRLCFEVGTSKYFDYIMLIVIIYNMLILCTFHYEQTRPWDLLQFWSDVVFTIIFVIEFIIKIIGLFPLQYFKSHYNKLDFIIVITSIIGIFVDNVGGFIKIFRVLRVFRIFKLFRIARRLRMIIKTLWLSLPAFINVGSVVFLVLFIYGVAGMNMFWDLPHGEYITHNSNFDNFLMSLFVLLRVATGEVWDEVMDEISEEKPVEAIIYFCSFQLVVAFLFLQLFVAVVIENFSFVTNLENGKLSFENLNRFKRIWRKYDPKATQYIPFSEFPNFLKDLKPPLGTSDLKEDDMNIFIEALDLPVTETDEVFFPDVLLSLTHKIYDQIGLPEGELYKAIYTQWKKAFPKVAEHKYKATSKSNNTHIESDGIEKSESDSADEKEKDKE